MFHHIFSYLFIIIYNYIAFVQDDIFTDRSLVAEINSIHDIYIDDFLTAQDHFQIFLSQRTSLRTAHFVLRKNCRMDVTSGLSSKISSIEKAWSYDNLRGCIISDISFKVDDTVFNRFNTDFRHGSLYRICRAKHSVIFFCVLIPRLLLKKLFQT